MTAAGRVNRISPGRVRLAAIALATATLAACPGAPHDGDTCDPAEAPHCSGGALVTCGVDGRTSSQTCSGSCLEMADDAGHHLAACVATGTAPCQMATFESGCVGDRTFVACEVVPPLEAAGHTKLTVCTGGRTCRESALAVACVDPGSETCDPATRVETCDQGKIITCNDDGFTSPLVACAPPSMCKVSAGDARCVRPDQDPCGEPFVETCVDDHTVEHCSFGFTDVYACFGSAVCRESPTTASCFDPQTPTCVASSFHERCEDGARVYCSDFGVEASAPCGEGRRCELEGEHAFCVDGDAIACDPATLVATCEGNVRVDCDPESGFTHGYDCGTQLCHATNASTDAYCVDPAGSACDAATYQAHCDGNTGVSCNATTAWTTSWKCGEGDVCYASGAGATSFAFCDKPGAVPCDFATYESRCEDGVASLCALFTGYTTHVTCKDGETCLADRLCLGPTCGLIALCQAPGGTPCDGTKEYWCDGQTMMNCFAGIAMPDGSCEEGKACTVDAAGAHCQ